jgi:hypothetical protein
MRKYLNNLREFAVANPETRKAFLGFSFFTALFLMSPFINVMLSFKPKIKDFSDHIISDAAVNNLDIAGRVSNYYNIFTGLLLVSALVFLFLYHFVGRKTAKGTVDKRLLKKLYDGSIIGISCVFASFLLINVDFSSFFVYFFCFFLLLQLKFGSENSPKDLAMWIVLVSFPFTSIIFTYFDNKNFYGILDHDVRINEILLPTDLKLMFLVAVYFLVALSFWFLGKLILRRTAPEHQPNQGNVLFLATLPLMFITIVQSLLLEIFNILNVRFGYVFSAQMKLYFLLGLLASGLSVFCFFRLRRRVGSETGANIINKYYHPLILLSLGLVCSQPYRLYNPADEFFEFANHGLSVDHFFRYGSIPIVETFDAHMLSSEFFAFIYGFLNGYEPWAVFLYFGTFSIGATFLLYYIFKKVLNPTVAFLIVVSLPLMTLLDNQFTFAGVLGLMLIKLLDNRSVKNHYLFWIAVVLLSLYKLDIGFAAIMAALVTYFAVNYILNKSFEFKKMMVPALVCIGAMLALFFILCLVKGVSPIGRLYEFLIVSMSNQNWAIEKMGDVNLTVFRLAYYLLPLTAFLMVLWVTIKISICSGFVQTLRDSKKLQYALILFLFFAGFFFFNIPRGIVRHTLAYGNIKQITSTIPFAILMFVLLFKRNRPLIFMASFIGVYFLISLTAPTLQKHEYSKLAETFGSISFKDQFTKPYDFNGTRVGKSIDLSEINAFKGILDKLLQPHETYFDFSSKNYYHALTKRKNPLYVNQTPLMINGDKSQDMALEQIRAAKVPIVLMPIREKAWSGIDGVFVEYKYYKISEYLFKNYSPIMRFPSFDIYALNSKRPEYLRKLVKKAETGEAITDFSWLQKPSTVFGNMRLVKDTDGKFKISAAGTSPFFRGMLEGLRGEKILDANYSGAAIFTLNITPGTAGSVRVYYVLNSQESYTEENTIEIPIQQVQAQDLTLKFPKMPLELMISINTGSIKFNSLKISKPGENIQPDAIPTQPEPADYWLGEVPRLWAERSNEPVFSKVSRLSNSLYESLASFKKKDLKNYRKPFYCYLEAESDVQMGGSVTLYDGNEKRASFHFNIVPGKAAYAIRLSSNYYWWLSTPESRIEFKTDNKAIRLIKFSLISEDGKEELQYSNKDLTLSNITDDNWYGGVGLKNGLVLFNYVPGREKLLKPGSKIVLNNGQFMTIRDIQVVENYIQVQVVENPLDFKEAAAFPNTVKIEK